MKLNIEGLRSNEPTQATELQRLCTTIANATTRRVGLHEYAQDLASELMLIVIERLPHVYDGVSEIDPFVWESARRLTMGYSRRARREFSASQSGDDEGSSLFDAMPDENTAVADAWTHDRITADQARAARQRLIGRMREVSGVAKKAEASKSANDSGQTQLAAVQTSEEVMLDGDRKERMKPWKERRQLGFTQSQMADALGISLSQLRRMERAGPLPARLQSQVSELLEKATITLPTEGASALLARWAVKLGLEADDVGALSHILGVHRTTIFRWRKGLAEPQGPAVLALEARIDALLDVRRRQPGRRP